MGKKLFDYVIGNPPYQEDMQGTSDKPVYNIFMDATYNVANKVELIHPARFLFNAGKTPKNWNKKMLNDPSFKILKYENNASRIFQNTDIKGGIAISYHSKNDNYGAIKVFVPQLEMNAVIRKIISRDFDSFGTIFYSTDSYHFSKKIYEDYPKLKGTLSKGHEYSLTSNLFDKFSSPILFEEKPKNDEKYVTIFGRFKNKRTKRYIKSVYIEPHPSLEKYKIMFPEANGTGKFGEIISFPFFAYPFECHTQTFVSIGNYSNKIEANNTLKYVKTKFCRALLDTQKVTQHTRKIAWKYVPMQDFTSNSDIDWSKSIHEIDLQLYRKYGLDENEIDFIETHVKEME